MIMRLENTWGNDCHNIRKHLNLNVNRFGPVKKLGQRRFLQLYHACQPTIQEIRKLNDILVFNSRR